MRWGEEGPRPPKCYETYEILQAARHDCMRVYVHTCPEMVRCARKAMKPLKYSPTDDEEKGGEVG